MQNINKVLLTGNVCREPELRQTPAGNSVLLFGLAVNDSIKNKQTGQWEDRPNFFDCVIFAHQAEALSKIVCKGMKLTVFGKLRQQTWEKDGQKRSRIEIYVDEVELPPRNQPSAQPAPQPAAQQAAQTSPYDEDLPF